MGTAASVAEGLGWGLDMVLRLLGLWVQGLEYTLLLEGSGWRSVLVSHGGCSGGGANWGVWCTGMALQTLGRLPDVSTHGPTSAHDLRWWNEKGTPFLSIMRTDVSESLWPRPRCPLHSAASRALLPPPTVCPFEAGALADVLADVEGPTPASGMSQMVA
jgi:hypothetical protein